MGFQINPLPRNSRSGQERAISVMLRAILLILGLSLGACAVAKDRYLVGHVGRATERDVRAKLGDPTFMQPGERGGIRFVYRDRDGWMGSDSGKSAESSDCVEYHLTFDSRSLLTNWTRTGC